jgi:hypothetical protein
MSVGAAGDDIEAARLHRFRERLGVLDDAPRVELEGGLQRFAEGHRLGGDHVHQGAALQPGKDRRVDLLGELLLVGEDETAARPTQCLMRGRGDHMGMRERAWMHAAGNQAGKMRHVDHEIGSDLIGDLTAAAKFDDARIGGAAGDDHFRSMFLRKRAHLLIVDPVVVGPHRVRDRLEPAAGQVHRRAVGEMAPGRKTEPQEGVAGLHQGQESRHIGGGAGMRLDVRKTTSKKLCNSFDRQRFRHVDELAAPIIAPPRQAFGIFICQH